ncbi:MAG TPA: dienelactone hydrolase family protein [Rhodothermia bacterium]|nr:dienelactone hydrolase family protein [Rhodothermia bacterium]
MDYFSSSVVHERTVHLQLADGRTLTGDLGVPDDAHGLVIFAHGSGSSRLSSRNRSVAAALWGGGSATLLLDLLTNEEERIDTITRQHRFDIDLLAERLVTAVDWASSDDQVRNLPIGLFGASTGAAAALVAAARRPDVIRAVVSRGGRPDLAGAEALELVRAPTLLIVGGYDTQVIDLNVEAMHRLRSTKRLEIVPRATHLFEEPGALNQVAALAREWFANYMPKFSLTAPEN